MTHKHPIYDDEKRFIINTVTKTVSFPEKDRPVLIQHDHNSEHITFECDRFVEGHDFMLCDKVEVHYNNVGPRNRSVKGVYPVEDLRIADSDKNKVVFTWIPSLNATTYAGPLLFVITFSCTNNGDITYRWNTNICKDLVVGEGIDNGEAVEQNYADVLENWRLDLFGIEDTAEANMRLYSKRIQDELEVKAREVMATMPDEYMEYSDFEKSKANVTDINRLLDSDYIANRFTNLYPHGDSSYEYDGTSVYSGVAAGDNFYLEEGTYRFILTDTNAVGVYVMLSEDNDIRLLELKNDFVGIHSFNVSSSHAGKPLVVKYYASGEAVNDAGTYYIKRPYIFKASDGPVFNDEFFVNPTYKLLESDVVKSQIGDNLFHGEGIKFYYDGVGTYIAKELDTFSLDEGDYTLTVYGTNAIKFVLTVKQKDGTTSRLIDSTTRPDWTKFTISSEHAGQPLTLSINASLSTVNAPGYYYVESVYIFRDDKKPFLPEYLTRNNSVESVLGNIKGGSFKAQNGALSLSANTLSANNSMVINAACDVKINKSLVFTGKFDTFTGLYVGHGKSAYGGTYVEVNETAVKVYQYESGATLSHTSDHGLTISDFITVVINVGFTKAIITVFTSTGSFTCRDVSWVGCNGNIFAESIRTAFTDCELKWISSDINHPVWVFGDSYLSINNNRWPGHMYNLGYKNWLACGFPGAASSRELASFKTLLTVGMPDIAVWCMGMNNPDSGAINGVWLTDTNEFISLCEANNIIPILATIPTCPKADNTYKNEWVRNSGYRYVDFEKAVGVNGTSWYDSMLSSDNVHPTELGAKALASRVCIDVPEIMQ